MNKNVGGLDRAARIIIGAAILSLAFIGPQTPWAYLGIVPLLTGLTGWCPPYILLGINTCKKEAGSCETKGDGGCCCS